MDTHRVYKALTDSIEGEVRFDDLTRTIYSTDASIYEVRPIGTVYPTNKNDIIATLSIASSFSVPVIPRGAATGITGGCLGKGIILDLSKYFNKILSIDTHHNVAICQAGVVQDALNEALASINMRLGPDTSTGNRATIGGMFANNAAGARSLRFGTMADHVQEVELILSEGEVQVFNQITLDEWEQLRKAPGRLGRIYDTAWKIREHEKDEIIKRYPPLPRRVSGYHLPALLDEDGVNLCKLIAGSEGTFGIASEITVGIVPRPQNLGLQLIFCESLSHAFSLVEKILPLQPLALELIDQNIIDAGRRSPALNKKLSWLQETPAALLVVEFDGPERPGKSQSLSRLFPQCSPVIDDPVQMQHVWDLRKAGLGLLMSKRSFRRAVAFLEDLSVPPSHLSSFMKEFQELLEESGNNAGIYGHVGAGCMHIRPYMDLRNASDRDTMENMMQLTTDMLLRYGGALSGEHGDGYTRSWLNEKLYGPRIYHAFQEIKSAFDPHNLINPDKVVNAPPFQENMRSSATRQFSTLFDFSRTGGFDLSVDMCNGNGSCRKAEGTMCPSFQATLDEKDSTRARANVFRKIFSDRSQSASLADEEIHEVLDLCLSCKGCKTECPSQIDMAKWKAESLYHYQSIHGTTLRNNLFGNCGYYFNKIAPLSGIVNWASKTLLGRYLQSLFGIAKERTLPQLAKVTFEQWSQQQAMVADDDRPRVILFNDTFTNFNHPAIGQAAYILLTRLGWKVIVPPWNCCGRTAISKGLLKTAKEQAAQLSMLLEQYGEIPVIVLEPSCQSAFIDDHHDLISSSAPDSRFFSLEDFLLQDNVFNKLKIDISALEAGKILIHTHCHQKALLGTKSTELLLLKLGCANIETIQSGCCGMAGSFGYEKEHYTLSQKIAELKLFPALRKNPEAIVITNGASCRAQIEQTFRHKILHLAEFLHMRLTAEN